MEQTITQTVQPMNIPGNKKWRIKPFWAILIVGFALSFFAGVKYSSFNSFAGQNLGIYDSVVGTVRGNIVGADKGNIILDKNGKKIIFQTDESIYIIDENGQNKQISKNLFQKELPLNKTVSLSAKLIKGKVLISGVAYDYKFVSVKQGSAQDVVNPNIVPPVMNATPSAKGPVATKSANPKP